MDNGDVAMWKCSKCGEQIEDQVDTCWKCAGAPPDVTIPRKLPASVYGRLSIVVATLAVGTFLVLGYSAGEGFPGMARGIVALFVAAGLFGLGGLLAVIGLLRGEDPYWVPVVGLILNAFPPLAVMAWMNLYAA